MLSRSPFKQIDIGIGTSVNSMHLNLVLKCKFSLLSAEQQLEKQVLVLQYM